MPPTASQRPPVTFQEAVQTQAPPPTASKTDVPVSNVRTVAATQKADPIILRYAPREVAPQGKTSSQG